MMDWRECVVKKIVKGVQIDTNLIKALQMQSENNAYACTMLKIDERTASAKVSLGYDALRELLEALAIKKGYKIYNHECYTPFLNEIIKDVAAGSAFDEYRKIRNGINYYGEKLSIKEAEAIIEKMNVLRKKMQVLLF